MPCPWRKTITSRMSRCRFHAAWIRPLRTLPMPSTSESRRGWRSSTSKVSFPNFRTIRAASSGPMPFTRPEPR